MYSHVRKALLPWQVADIRAMFGTVKAADGSRQFRRAYLERAKKNGKTFLVGGVPIYHLVGEGGQGQQGYGAAATKEQAGLVYKAAGELIDANPTLRKLLRMYPSAKRIIRRDGLGYYQVVSSDGKGSDGVEPTLAIFDEVHRWTTAKAQTLWDVLWKGMISVPEPLGIMTTTAGDEDESLIWNQERDLAQSIIDGETKAPTYYASIYAADARRVKDEPEYWMSREARVEANPSHEDRGGFLRDDAIVEELNKALKSGAQGKASFLRYHLGVRVSQTDNSVIDMAQWVDSTDPGVDLRTWPVYDVELLVSKWNLAERPCVLGVDASWSTDLTALAAVFPPAKQSEPWVALVWYWMPAGQVRKLETGTQVPYSQWIEKGFIETCPGKANDYNLIVKRAKWCREMFDVREVCYDPWNFRPTAIQLEEDGFTCVETRQNIGELTGATKDLLAAYQDVGRLWHGNNPVTNYCARSLSTVGDKNDNVKPAKPERMKTKKRIDGLAAIITAWSRARVLTENGVDLDAFLNNPVGV